MDVIAKSILPLSNSSKLRADALLAEIFHADDASGKKQYVLGGLALCRDALTLCLGVSEHRVQRLQHGHPDLRFGKRSVGDPRTPDRKAYSHMFGFLYRG